MKRKAFESMNANTNVQSCNNSARHAKGSYSFLCFIHSLVFSKSSYKDLCSWSLGLLLLKAHTSGEASSLCLMLGWTLLDRECVRQCIVWWWESAWDHFPEDHQGNGEIGTKSASYLGILISTWNLWRCGFLFLPTASVSKLNEYVVLSRSFQMTLLYTVSCLTKKRDNVHFQHYKYILWHLDFSFNLCS